MEEFITIIIAIMIVCACIMVIMGTILTILMVIDAIKEYRE